MTAWLLTWLWQGLALTLVMSGAFRLLPRLNAATRYCDMVERSGCVRHVGRDRRIGCDRRGRCAPDAPVPDQSHLIRRSSLLPDALFAIVVGVWLAMALVLLVRPVPDVRAVFRLRDRCRDFPPEVEAELPLWLEAKARRGSATGATWCSVTRSEAPQCLAFHRPYIAVPTSC